jgi:3alpha(or 20beta)-hydroxysteroid dehydrogenase
MGRLSGKVVVLTGCSGTLGSAQARTLAQQGARLVATDVNASAGSALVTVIRETGAEAQFMPLDVVEELEWKRVLGEVQVQYGRLDVLVNNAGINLPRASIDARTGDEWDLIMAVNAKSAFLGTKHAIPLMRASGGGSIVNIASLAGLGRSKIMEAAYAASKAAMTMLTRVTAAQHGADHIRCNSVHPGPISSEMLRGYYSSPELKAERLALVPLGRFGEPEEVANTVLFLASDESSYVNGAQIVVDGGSLVM